MRSILVLTFFFVSAICYGQSKKFELKGRIGQLGAPAKVYLRYSMGNEPRIDSVTMKKGKFYFSGKLDEPVMGSLFLSRNGRPIQWPYDELMLYLDTVPVLINSMDSMKHAKTTGSRLNEELQLYDAMMKPVRLKVQKNEQLLQNNGGEGSRQKDSFMTMLRKEAAAINSEFIGRHPGSLVSVNALRWMSNEAGSMREFDSLFAMFSQLAPALKNSRKAQDLYLSMEKKMKLLPGMIAPEIIQPDSMGREVRLSSLRGKFVLIDFWASWCKPCRADNKELVKIFEQYRNSNFMIMGVSVDTRKDAWLKAVKDDHLLWLQVSDLLKENAAADLYQISGVPTSYLLDPDGVILAKDLRGMELKEMLEKILR